MPLPSQVAEAAARVVALQRTQATAELAQRPPLAAQPPPPPESWAGWQGGGEEPPSWQGSCWGEEPLAHALVQPATGGDSALHEHMDVDSLLADWF